MCAVIAHCTYLMYSLYILLQCVLLYQDIPTSYFNLSHQTPTTQGDPETDAMNNPVVLQTQIRWIMQASMDTVHSQTTCHFMSSRVAN